MAGHMGNTQVAQQNLVVVRVDSDRNLILISGSIPGSKGTDVIIRPAVKSDAVLSIPDPKAVAAEEADSQAVVDTVDAGQPQAKENQ